MGFIGDILDPAKGAGFQAQGTNLINPSIKESDLTDLYGNVKGGLNQQQAFVNALNAQNGLSNQQSVFGQQQALADQLGAQARGEGPNPAQMALQNATGNNVAQQAALMGSARGAGANSGLIARQAAQQGAGIQQQAAGQSALMQAQQQIAAQQALGQQQAQMAGMANQQVNQQAAGLNAYNQFAQGAQSNANNAVGAYNNAAVGAQNNMNNVNGGIASGNQKSQAGAFGSLSNALGPAMMALHKGGMVQGYADGGSVQAVPPVPLTAGVPGQPSSYATFHFNGDNSQSNTQDQSSPQFQQDAMTQAGADFGKFGAQAVGKGLSSIFGGGAAADTGLAGVADLAPMVALASRGGKIKGQAKVDGDSQKNDTVPTMLSPGEIVIPRSIAKSKDAPDKAKAFVEAVLAHGMKAGKK